MTPWGSGLCAGESWKPGVRLRFSACLLHWTPFLSRVIPPWRPGMCCLLFVAGMALETVGRAGPVSFVEQASRVQRFQARAREGAGGPPIRVLIYGQSIVAQPWSMSAVRSFAAAHPGPGWVIENRSVGGVTMEYLVRLAEADLFPFNPDLVILHAYGTPEEQSRMLGTIRTRTTAEVMVFNNHYASWDASVLPGLGAFDSQHLPAVAAAHDACLVDVRTPWRDELIRRQMPIASLLLDHVHPNEQGQRILGTVLSDHLHAPVSQPPVNPWDGGRVRRTVTTAIPGASARRLAFHGNRVQVLAPARSRSRVLIDGAAPSQTRAGRVHGHPTPWPGTRWPFHLHIRHEAPLLDERWTLRVTAVEPDGHLQFSVSGGVTGSDGEGHSSKRFVSRSGRVVLEPEDWYWSARVNPVGPGTEMFWATEAVAVDRVEGGAEGRWLDAVSNLPVGDHVLELFADPGSPPVEICVVHDPSAVDGLPPGRIHQLSARDGLLLRSAGPVEVSSDLVRWRELGRDGLRLPGGWLRPQDPAGGSQDGTGLFYRAGEP